MAGFTLPPVRPVCKPSQTRANRSKDSQYRGTFGNRQAKGAHIGEQTGPTRVQGYTGRGGRCRPGPGPCSCSMQACSLPSGRRVKRSRALRGRNPTRDSPADGVPMARGPLAPRWWARAPPPPSDTRAHASKIPGVWGRRPQGGVPPAAECRLTHSSCPAWSSSTPGSGSFRHSSRRCGSGASDGPEAPPSSARPGRPGPTR